MQGGLSRAARSCKRARVPPKSPLLPPLASLESLLSKTILIGVENRRTRVRDRRKRKERKRKRERTENPFLFSALVQFPTHTHLSSSLTIRYACSSKAWAMFSRDAFYVSNPSYFSL